MSRNLTIELPFSAPPAQIAERMAERATKAGARLEFDPSGLRGTFQVRKLVFTVAGTFDITPTTADGNGGTARVNVATAPAFVSDDQIRSQLTSVFAEIDV